MEREDFRRAWIPKRAATVCCAALLLSAGQPQSETSLPQTNPEFPSADASVWRMQRTGLVQKLAARRLADAPDASDTAGLLVEAGRFDDAVGVMRRVVETRPSQMASMFEALAPRWFDFFRDQSHDYSAALRDVGAAAERQLSAVGPEDAARTERALMWLENRRSQRDEQLARLTRFIQEHAGTMAATIAEVDAIGLRGEMRPRGGIEQRIEALDAFAREHPGTVAGAKALFEKGFQLATNFAITGIEPRGSDPTERFLKVSAIVAELESGRFPPCEWIDRAPSLVVRFFAAQPTYAPPNVDRMLDAYQAFVDAHFARADGDSGESDVGYVIGTKMFDLFALKGDAVAGVEGVFTRLEKDSTVSAKARYMRAQLYVKRMNGAQPAARAELLQKANETLESLSRGADGSYARQALAAAASLSFENREFAAARERYARYLELHPRSDWAWVAALRLGQCEEALDHWRAAADAYRAAARSYESIPMARTLGYAYAARADEALGRFHDARADYERAVSRWDRDYGDSYWLRLPRPAGSTEPLLVDPTIVKEAALVDRLARLKETLAMRGGALLERGRWLLDAGKPDQAVVPLDELISRYPGSTAVPAARNLAHRARLQLALEAADIEGAQPDEAAAVRMLDAVAREPYDFGVCAAKIARATIAWKQTASNDARTTLADALAEWRVKQPTRSVAKALAPIEDDVAQIRALLFRPAGDGIFKATRWNGFEWPSSPSPFVIVNADVSVNVDGAARRATVYGPLDRIENALFLSTDEIALLDRIVTKLGGTKRRQPTAIMQVPNQPVGAARDIVAFWSSLFPARPGHWGGWVFETYPILGQITFTDAQRTKATAAVTVGYAGATVVLEKEQGVWKAVRLVNQWVT